MEQPEAWFLLGQYIHQDFMLEFPDFWSGVSAFVSGLDSAEKVKLLAYLTFPLDSGLSDEQLAKAWFDTGANLVVDENDTREFLKAMKACIEASPAVQEAEA